MRYLLNSREMKQCDSRTISYFGISQEVLMERAALAVVSFLRKEKKDVGKVLVLAGSGNNGGDGLAVARLLHLLECDVTIGYIGDGKKATEANLHQLSICKRYEVPILENIAAIAWEDYDVIIDGLFGIGLSREIAGDYKIVIEQANAQEAYRVAIDIASGVSTDDGQILGIAFQADVTLAMGFAKIGSILYPGRMFSGEVIPCEIGIDVHSFEEYLPRHLMLDHTDLAMLPDIPPDAYKGSRGKVLLIAGNEEMAGAAYLAAYATFLSGAGMVKIYTHRANREILLSRLPEALVVCYDRYDERQLLELLPWADTIAMGPGIGTDATAKRIVDTVLQAAAVPMVLDADALNILASHPQWLDRPHTETVITPHPAEMARLLDTPLMYVLEHKLSVCEDFARDHQMITVLKDAATITAVPYASTYVNASGNAGMATAGSGDVLTGVIAGLIAQGIQASEAAPLGVYLHGLAGDQAAVRIGKASMRASDIASGLPDVLMQSEKNTTSANGE